MKQYWLTLLTILALSFTGSVLAADTTYLKSYQAGDWKTLAKASNGAPLAIHFWGVTCPACVKEMPQWGQFLKGNPNARVVFIQVDDVPTDSMQNEIDPKWHGETPTTIVIDKNGKATRKTGLVDFQMLQNALKAKS